MNCPNCGASQESGAKYCTVCGSALPAGGYAPRQEPARPANTLVLPERYRPLGAWAYFGYAILFSIPLVGFICLIIFSLNDDNINRRNFARSYWCGLIVAIVMIILFAILIATTGASYEFSEMLSEYASEWI